MRKFEPIARLNIRRPNIMPPIIAVLEIIAMSYLAIRAENAVKLELQS